MEMTWKPIEQLGILTTRRVLLFAPPNNVFIAYSDRARSYSATHFMELPAAPKTHVKYEVGHDYFTTGGWPVTISGENSERFFGFEVGYPMRWIVWSKWTGAVTSCVQKRPGLDLILYSKGVTK